MWVKLIVSVTLLPMLLHSIFGCCWHHAHSECDDPCVRLTADSHAGHSHAHCQCVEDNDPNSPSPSGDDEPCDDVRCVYIAAKPVGVTFAFELYEHGEILDVSGFQFLSAPATKLMNLDQNRTVVAALEQCALTQVWIV
ncbi:MAG: hypothetical protein WKF77_03195 [Planctomycetaceae bacterium]